MVERFGKYCVFLTCQVDLVTLLSDGIVVRSSTREGLPGGALIICLIATNISTTKIFLWYIKMNNINHIERLRFVKTGGERTLFHDIIYNCPGKSENLKPQGPLRVLLLCFLLSSSPPKLFSKVAVLKFGKIPLETLSVDFCFDIDLHIYRN